MPKIPSYDDVAETTDFPEGEYDFVAVGAEGTYSNSGAELLNIELAVDNGEMAGTRIVAAFFLDEKPRAYGMVGLRQFCETTGFGAYANTEDMESFGAQFQDRIEGGEKLRTRATVFHSLSIQRDGDWINNVGKDEYEAHTGKKNSREKVRLEFKPPLAAAEVTPSPKVREETATSGAAPKATADLPF